MATQEDALRLAVEAVDKFSGQLREMTKSFHQFSGRGQVWSGEKSPPLRDRAEGEEPITSSKAGGLIGNRQRRF